ncbi:MAG: tRNA 4-thiouridine(8) synthase ThiI [Smithellaceae bacterium]|jgi:tRNA U34 2-thiouridine synthase MnmA/TrmU|nr:tRNA 4-thiouridine(8) synthase ThiI [Syntrophaceae bacterium]
MTKAIALFSGGLDSILAVRLVQKQNIDVTGLALTSPFFDASRAKTAALQIGLSLMVRDITGEYLQMLASPRYGFGKNMNPCIDCHTLMLKVAGGVMEERAADFLITGEVLGQRPMSQNRQSLQLVAKNSGYADFVLRPLSAKLLAPVSPEREGQINRELLAGISGRGRKEQMRLAEEFGITDYPPPAGGCLLTDPIFTRRFKEMSANETISQPRQYELLKYGRHFRAPNGAKIIVGRNAADNDALRQLAGASDLTCNMSGRPGPFVLAPAGNEEALSLAAALCARYANVPENTQAEVMCNLAGLTRIVRVKPLGRDECAQMII